MLVSQVFQRSFSILHYYFLKSPILFFMAAMQVHRPASLVPKTSIAHIFPWSEKEMFKSPRRSFSRKDNIELHRRKGLDSFFGFVLAGAWSHAHTLIPSQCTIRPQASTLAPSPLAPLPKATRPRPAPGLPEGYSPGYPGCARDYLGFGSDSLGFW